MVGGDDLRERLALRPGREPAPELDHAPEVDVLRVLRGDGAAARLQGACDGRNLTLDQEVDDGALVGLGELREGAELARVGGDRQAAEAGDEVGGEAAVEGEVIPNRADREAYSGRDAIGEAVCNGKHCRCIIGLILNGFRPAHAGPRRSRISGRF